MHPRGQAIPKRRDRDGVGRRTNAHSGDFLPGLWVNRLWLRGPTLSRPCLDEWNTSDFKTLSEVMKTMRLLKLFDVYHF